MKSSKLLFALLALAVAAACGPNSVGSRDLFNYTPKPPGNFGFQSPTPNAQAAIGGRTPQPTAVATHKATPPPAPKFQIGIFGDNSSTPGFFPPNANIYKGTIIVFTNHDTKPRSVATDPGDPATFKSPLIPPGGTWQYMAGTLGTYNYHDGTRPYAVAAFKVINR